MKPLCMLVLALLCAVSVSAQQISYDDFLTQLAEKTRLRDDKGYDKLLRANTPHVVRHFRGTVRALAAQPDSAGNQAMVDALKASWQREYKSDTLERVERWVMSLDPSDLRKFDQSIDALHKGYSNFSMLQSTPEKARRDYEVLAESMRKVAQSFEYYGEHYQAADAWGLLAQVYNSMPGKTIEDRKEAMFSIDQFKTHREAWHFTEDEYYKTNISWMKGEKERIAEDEKLGDRRVEAGYAEDVKGAEAFLVPDADKVEKTFPLTFKVLAKPPLDMSPQGGPVPLRWPSVEVTAKGPSQMLWFKANDLFIVRPGTAKYGITLDGIQKDLDENPFELIGASNKLRKPAMFKLDAEGNRDYAMWFYLPSNAELYQGVSQNFEPVVDRAVLYYKSASSWVANVDGTPIVFFDDNSNGRIFEASPFDYGLTLRTLTSDPKVETKVPTFDSMKIGKAPPQPYSEWVQIDGAWYHLRPKGAADSIGVRPVNPEFFKTGKLQLKFGAPKTTTAEVMIVQGRGDFATARFDLAGGDPVEVPVGAYTLQYGRILEGKGNRVVSADVFAGSSTEVIVEADKTAVLQLGEPFRIEFERVGTGRDVKIDALSIHVVGVAGEKYVQINGAVPEPQILAARDDSGKGAKAIGEFIAMTDPEMLSRVSRSDHGKALGPDVGFYPVVKGDQDGKLVFEGFAPDDSLVGLAQDKNKLFGKLLPIFK